MLLSLTESASDVDVVTPLKLWKNYILFRSTLLLTNNALITPLYVCLMWMKVLKMPYNLLLTMDTDCRTTDITFLCYYEIYYYQIDSGNVSVDMFPFIYL